MFRVMFTLLVFLSMIPTAHATTLKIATLAPDGTSWMKQLRTAAAKVKEDTDGRVKIRFYPGGVMGNDNSVLRKIRVGQLHGGAITGGGLMAIYPDAELYSLPFLFRNLQEVDHVRGTLDRKIIDGIKSKGFISYGLGEGGFAYLMSNQPVQTTSDLKGLKIWLPEGDMVNIRAFQAIGISPIPLPVTDVLTGLQTGLIDTVATSSMGAVALQWHTRVKYLTQVPLVYLYATLVIKESAMKNISEADRAILQREMAIAFEQLNIKNRSDEQAALEALKQQGIKFIQPSPEEHLEWEQHAASTIADLSNVSSFSPELLQQLQQLIRDYRQTNGQAVSE